MEDLMTRLDSWQDYEPAKAFCPEMLKDVIDAKAEITRLRFALQVARTWMPAAKPEQPHGDIDKAHKIVSDALEQRTL